MDFYSIIAIFIRISLSYVLFQRGKLALSSQTINLVSSFYLIAAASMLLGFYTNVTTLILLIYLSVRMWKRRQKKISVRKEIVLLVLTLIIFIKSSGAISLDKLLGNI